MELRSIATEVCSYYVVATQFSNFFLLRSYHYLSSLFFCFGPKAPGAHRAHGPRPLGPIGLIFRRTITVTGKVQFLEGP